MVSYKAAQDMAAKFLQQVEKWHLLAFSSIKHHYPLIQKKIETFHGALNLVFLTGERLEKGSELIWKETDYKWVELHKVKGLHHKTVE